MSWISIRSTTNVKVQLLTPPVIGIPLGFGMYRTRLRVYEASAGPGGSREDRTQEVVSAERVEPASDWIDPGSSTPFMRSPRSTVDRL
jgi:hypothetical protein